MRVNRVLVVTTSALALFTGAGAPAAATPAAAPVASVTVESVSADRTAVTVSGLATAPIRYTVRMRGEVRSDNWKLRLVQPGARGTVPIMVPLEQVGGDASAGEFTGTLPVSAAHGPRLVPDAVIDGFFETPGEICMGTCGTPAPAAGPTVTVTATHAPKLTVAMRPSTIALPARTTYPARSPKVRLDVTLADTATGQAFATRERLAVRVGYRTPNGTCRTDGNIPTMPLDAKGTTSRTVTTDPETGARSSLDDAPHCAVLTGAATFADGTPSPRASVDDVMRFTTPIAVEAPGRWRADRSIPIKATVDTYAAHGHVTMQVQRLHGRTAWRTVAVTKARPLWGDSGFPNVGSVRIPAKGKGTAVYRVVATSSVGAMAPSTSKVFQVR